jgi:hypothetical protein
MGATIGINARDKHYRKLLSLSLSITNSNVLVDPGLLVLHAQWIGSTVPRQSNSMDGTKYESESCEAYTRLRSSPFIGIGTALGTCRLPTRVFFVLTHNREKGMHVCRVTSTLDSSSVLLIF